MAQIEEAIALGIGPQAARGTINAFVRDATDLIPGPAAAGGATGILLRNPEDLAKSMARIQTDLGVVTGSRTRVTGGFVRVEPTVSFDIDWKGNGDPSATPTSPEFDALEYLLQLLEGHRLLKGTSGGTSTPYEFGIPAADEQYKTLKIWRGDTAGVAESWVLQDCQFNLSWNIVPGEKSVMTVDVLAGLVLNDPADTFPTSPDYSTQVEAPPIVGEDNGSGGAGASLDGTVRGFRSCTITSAYPVIEKKDSNVTGGILRELGTPRDIQVSAEWYADTADDDFADLLERDAGAPLFFTIGSTAGAGEKINAWRHDIPLFRGETATKVDDETGKVVRTIDGYASHTTGDAEMTVTAV